MTLSEFKDIGGNTMAGLASAVRGLSGIDCSVIDGGGSGSDFLDDCLIKKSAYVKGREWINSVYPEVCEDDYPVCIYHCSESFEFIVIGDSLESPAIVIGPYVLIEDYPDFARHNSGQGDSEKYPVKTPSQIGDIIAYCRCFMKERRYGYGSKSELAGSGEIFSRLFDNLGDPAFIIDLPDFKIDHVNDAALKLYGYSRDEFAEINLLAISAEPEETKYALLDSESVIRERLHRKKNGEIFCVETKSSYFEICGRKKSVTVVRDVSYRKQAEQNLKNYSQTLETAIESASLGFWDWDMERGKVKFNDILKDMMNLNTSANEGDESDFVDLVDGNGRIAFLNKIKSHWRGETSSFTHEFKIKNSTGEERWINSLGRVIERNVDNRAVRMLGFNRDITESRRAEQAIIDSKNRAEESDKLKTAFLANMSHEIRTPLNAILGFSRLLSRIDLDLTTIRKYNDIIKVNSEQLMRIVSDILDISKIENSQLELFSGEIEVYQFLKDQFSLLESLIHQAGKSNLKIEVKYPGDNALILADSLRLNQIMNNLISNSVKFTDSGSITIGCGEVNGEFLELFVEDSGIGINSDDKEIIFDRFRQVDNSYTRNYGGTGLGLAISKKLAQLMNGDINAESEPGRGSTFYVKIPVAEKSDNDADTGELSVNIHAVSGRKTILVADDIWHIHDYLKALLGSKMYSLLSAYNGEEAFRIARDNDNIDLVLMDIQMPIMNGIDSMNKIKGIRPDLPVIAFTAHAMMGDRGKYMKQGFNEYISKPVDVEVLYTLLDKYLA